jgi:dephospho-CoA kinase
VKIVGLTGGIGCGKSTVAAWLAARDAVRVDVDVVTRELQVPGMPVFDSMMERWGDQILGADGALDRQAVARIAFHDPIEMQALMAMTTPAVDATVRARIEAVVGTNGLVVLEAALFAGGSHLYGMAGLVVVDAPETLALERLVRGRGMDEADAQVRMSRQLSREQRLAGADFVIDNGGDFAHLEAQLGPLWAWILDLPDDTYDRMGAT